MGLVAYDRLWTTVAFALGAAGVLYVGWRERWMASLPCRTGFRLLLLVALAQALLVTAPIEFIHYPQYALVSMLLAQAGLPPEIAWWVTTGASSVDELHQRLTMTRGTPDYFDWNDVVLNATGAAIGLLLLRAGRRPAWSLTFTRRTMTVLLATAAIASLALAPPVFVPYFTETPRHTWFRVLSPFETTLWLAVIWTNVRRLVR